VAIFNSIPFTWADLATNSISLHFRMSRLWRGGNVREHLSASLLLLHIPHFTPVNMYLPWSLYIYDRTPTTPTSLQ
jgi:hypothetical protein